MFLEVDENGEVLTARRLRKRGMRKVLDMQMALGRDPSAAEASGRSALHDIVDAFLIDRSGQADLFAFAHRLGRELLRQFGCAARYDEEEHVYTYECPVFTIHSQVASSIGWSWEVTCSICDAELFGCDHIPGDIYDGETCHYRPTSTPHIDHVALTARPDFPYTWLVDNRRSAQQLIRDRMIARQGDVARCWHCEHCYGLVGPTADDVDPVTAWRRHTEEHRAGFTVSDSDTSDTG